MVFEAAISAFFTDSNFSCSAIYSPLSGSDTEVRIIKKSVDALGDRFLSNDVVAEGDIADVRISDIPARPEDGSTLTIDGDVYVIRSAEMDGQKLTWQLNLDKV